MRPRNVRVSRLKIKIIITVTYNGHDSVSNHQPHHCLLNRLFGCRSKKTSNLRVTGLCAGNSPGTVEFPAKMASNAENVSIWWRHHVADCPRSGTENESLVYHANGGMIHALVKQSSYFSLILIRTKGLLLNIFRPLLSSCKRSFLVVYMTVVVYMRYEVCCQV